jgi:thioredoxin-related protein
MDAVTYPDTEVISFINEHMIPLRVQHDTEPTATDFNVKRTPTVVTLDPEGNEHHRTVGFLGPEDLIASLLLGIAKVYFDKDQFGDALLSLNKILSEHANSDSAPEAIFIKGVSEFKSFNNPNKLRDAYERLKSHYPDNEWTKRAYPYSLI